MKLQDIRKKSGLSQSELSHLSDVKLRTIQEYENGRRQIDNAHIDTLISIAEVLKVPFYELMEDAQRIQQIKENVKREV